MAKRKHVKPVGFQPKWTLEQIQAHAERRRIINIKHGLLTDLGFVWFGDRYQHPNGKRIFAQPYMRMDFMALLVALKHLGFAPLTDVLNEEVAAAHDS